MFSLSSIVIWKIKDLPEFLTYETNSLTTNNNLENIIYFLRLAVFILAYWFFASSDAFTSETIRIQLKQILQRCPMHEMLLCHSFLNAQLCVQAKPSFRSTVEWSLPCGNTWKCKTTQRFQACSSYQSSKQPLPQTRVPNKSLAVQYCFALNPQALVHIFSFFHSRVEACMRFLQQKENSIEKPCSQPCKPLRKLISHGHHPFMLPFLRLL